MPNAQVCVFDDTYYKITIINYISKTSLYTAFRMYSSGPWPLKILLGLLLILISKSWGCPPLGQGMPFLDSDTCRERGVIYFCQVFFLVWCYPWMDDGTDGWTDGSREKLHKKRPQLPLLYVMPSRPLRWWVSYCMLSAPQRMYHFHPENDF